jgi:hypothetical protein
MDDTNETIEDYTSKDLAKDIAVGVAQTATSYAIAVGILLTAGYIYQKHLDRKAAKNANQS